MYTRTENPLHIIQEVIDNAADEALAGFGRCVSVTLHADGSVSIEDDGRGIPVGLHEQEQAPVVEVVFTRLHAGGKFDKKSGGAYAFSGGLHGVGVSVTNALSRRMEVRVKRDGSVHEVVFAGGDVETPLAVVGTAPRRASGTSVRVWPDAQYFDSPVIPVAELMHSLRSKAVLLAGVRFEYRNEKTGEVQSWQYDDGVRSYLEQALGDAERIVPAFEGSHYAGADDETYSEGEGAQWVVVWTADGPTVRESYVNLISTTGGGTHEAGLRDGLFNAVKSFAELHSLIPKGVKLLPEDVFARASFVLSAKVLDPQFQGQIKEKLNSRDAVRMVSGYVKNALELWLHGHVEYGRKLAESAIRQAQARARSAQKVEKRKSSGVAVLPGKLT
ncbi:MAG: DNA topoisomerase IV subunit B, partial [Alcaligenaceae bacterium]|nr:DNA topoisomerase IV subunit B [Alcaligenaceae bacterium]